jgi:Xaa-Pro aminopeptidase
MDRPLERLQQALADADLPAMLVSNVDNLRWLTGFTGSYGFAIVTPERGCFVSDSRYSIQAAQQVSCLPVETFSQPRQVVDLIEEQLAALEVARLAIDSKVVTLDIYARWRAALTGCELIAANDPIDELRRLKSAWEVARIRSACELTDACLEYLAPRITSGRTELELLQEIREYLRRHGSEPSFLPCVSSGPRSALPHGRASDRPVGDDEYVLIDLGARVDGYCSDVTRTFVAGQPTERQREIHARVLEAQQAAIAALVPGAEGQMVDHVARQSLAQHGLDGYFGHGLGHGLGLLVHDSGRLAPTVEQVIEAGQVWTIEPGVYIEDFGGVRIEDDVLVTLDGPEVLSTYPRGLS